MNKLQSWVSGRSLRFFNLINSLNSSSEVRLKWLSGSTPCFNVSIRLASFTSINRANEPCFLPSFLAMSSASTVSPRVSIIFCIRVRLVHSFFSSACTGRFGLHSQKDYLQCDAVFLSYLKVAQYLLLGF